MALGTAAVVSASVRSSSSAQTTAILRPNCPRILPALRTVARWSGPVCRTGLFGIHRVLNEIIYQSFNLSTLLQDFFYWHYDSCGDFPFVWPALMPCHRFERWLSVVTLISGTATWSFTMSCVYLGGGSWNDNWLNRRGTKWIWTWIVCRQSP